MTEETLKRANDISDDLYLLKKALRKLGDKNCQIQILSYGDTLLPKSFKEPIKLLVKNEIARLEKQLADL